MAPSSKHSHDNKIEELKKKLYSNAGENVVKRRGKLHEIPLDVPRSWDEAEISSGNPVFDTEESDRSDRRGSLLKKILFGALVFAVLALFAAWYVIFQGDNFVKSDSIDITIQGPVAVPSGEIMSLDVFIKNNNKSDLLLTDLVIKYPEGTRSAVDGITAIPMDRISVGTIKAGETAQRTVKAILFGEENIKKNIRFTLEYRLQGSRTVFAKDKNTSMFIGNSPVTLNVEYLKESIEGQQTTFLVKLKSNSSTVVRGVMLQANYPFGFNFIESDPEPSLRNNVWRLGDISPNEEREIEIIGSVVGQSSQERNFKFFVGTEDSNDSSKIDTVFASSDAEVTVKRPFLVADLSLDGSSDDVGVALMGDPVQGEVQYQNNLDVAINDAVIKVNLYGDILDKKLVNGDRAFYRSQDNVIIWDKTTLPALANIPPGEGGRVTFTVSTIEPTVGVKTQYKNASFKVSVNIEGKRLNEQSVPETIQTFSTKEVRIASGLRIDSILARTMGPLQNTGPIPPKVDSESSYTAIITLTNSFNEVKEAVMTTTLPNYVKWSGQWSPSDARVSYNPDKREVTWNIGTIPSGAGFTTSPVVLYFKVSLVPSVSQANSTPVMVNNQKILAKDVYIDRIVEDVAPELDIKIERDPLYEYGDDKVVE